MRGNPRPKDITMEYVRLFIGISATSIQLDKAPRNYELRNIHIFMLPSFHRLTNKDSLSFIRAFYATIQTFPLGVVTND